MLKDNKLKVKILQSGAYRERGSRPWLKKQYSAKKL